MGYYSIIFYCIVFTNTRCGNEVPGVCQNSGTGNNAVVRQHLYWGLLFLQFQPKTEINSRFWFAFSAYFSKDIFVVGGENE